MPKYRITAPTGETYEVTAPEGATQEQVMAYVQSQHQPQQPSQAQGDTSGADRVATINDTLGGSVLGLGAHGLNYLEKYVDAHTSPDSTMRKAVDTVADNVIGAPVAAAHHAVNAPLGLVQLGAHAIPGAGNAAAKLDNFIKQREDTYQSGVPTNAGSIGGAAVGEVAPWVAGLGSARAAGYLPKATTTLQKLGMLAAEGGAMGASQPVTDGGSFAGQKALQVGTGATAGPLLYGAGKVGGSAVNAARYITNPQAVADNVLSQQFGATPDIVSKLRNAPQLVQGERVSAAQAIQTPEAVKAERMLRNSLSAGPVMAAQDDANNAVRQGVIRRLAGDDATLAAARQARRDAIAPYVDEKLTDSKPVVRWTGAGDAFKGVLDNPSRMPAADFDAVKQASGIVSKVRGGSMQEDDALAALKELGGTVTSGKAQKAFQAASEAINRNMVDPSGVLRAVKTLRYGPLGVNAERAQKLDAIIGSIEKAQNINGLVGTDMLDAVRQEAAKIAGGADSQSSLAYGPALNQIVEAIDRVAPGYRDYLAAYAKHSEPINTMESVQKLLDPNAPGSLNTSGDPQLAISRLRQVLRGDDKARYPMSDEARAELEKVRDSLLRRTISDNKVAAAGPGTAADLGAGKGGLAGMIFGDPLGQKAGSLSRVVGTIGGTALGHMVGGPLGGYAGAGIGALLPEAAQKVTGRIASRVGEGAADSRKAADAIERTLKSKNHKTAQKALERILFGHDLELPRQGRN